MNKLDRRFINVSLVVEGIANEPAANPTAGMQYIVGMAGTGVFKDKAANSIAKYNGTSWDFTAPDVYGMEVINKETSSILKWNGTEWVVFVSFADSGKTISLVAEGYVAEPPETHIVGVQYLIWNGEGAFAGQAQGTIARYNGTGWDFITPKIGDQVFIKERNEFSIYIGSEGWNPIAHLTDVMNRCRSSTTITESDISSNWVFLADYEDSITVATDSVLIFLNGILCDDFKVTIHKDNNIYLLGVSVEDESKTLSDYLKVGDVITLYCYYSYDD